MEVSGDEREVIVFVRCDCILVSVSLVDFVCASVPHRI